MTLEEKLNHFEEICFSDARERNSRMLKEYEASLRKTLEEHRADARRQADMQVKAEAEKIGHEINRQLASEQISLRKAVSSRQAELKTLLINELKDRLALYMSTPAYQDLLIRQVREAKAFAGENGITIYLDPCDTGLLRQISLAAGVGLTLSRYSFLGGTRAVIPEKNILIDNSFQKRLSEIEETFQITV